MFSIKCFSFCFLLDFNECVHDGHDCHPNATCDNYHGSYFCHCNKGYEGNGKNCTNVDECDTNTHNCHSNATCRDKDGSFDCTCNTGFTGQGVNCTNIDECATQTHNCALNATCSDNQGSFACSCNPGHTGNGTTCLGMMNLLSILSISFIFHISYLLYFILPNQVCLIKSALTSYTNLRCLHKFETSLKHLFVCKVPCSLLNAFHSVSF